jgi:hypothetical protein
MDREPEDKLCGRGKKVLGWESVPSNFMQVSLSASKDNQEATESPEGGALRLVGFIQLNIHVYDRNP